MKSGRKLDYVWLVILVAVTRFLFRSRYLYDVDSVNFALALERFDPQVHQPHPPGYFLYVWLGRLAHALIPEANAALVAVSIAASCAAAAVIYALTAGWFGRRAAIFAGLIFVVSPLAWFHGTVALTYIVEAFFAALVGYLCWQTYSGRTGFLIPVAVLLGVAAGFRQSSILFLGPLWLLSLWKASRAQKALGTAVLACTVLAWFIPMVLASGGTRTYFEALYTLWMSVPGQGTVFNSSPVLSLVRAWMILGIFLLCMGSAVALLWVRRREDLPGWGAWKMFVWVWVTPGLLFFTFFFLKFVNSGYLLVLSPPVFAWLGRAAAAWHADGRPSPAMKTGILAICAVVNVGLFLYSPFYISHRSVRIAESELRGAIDGVRRATSPDNTFIVGFDSHFLGYRHAGYYLPDYWVAAHPEATFPAGKRVFAMKGRSTELLATLPSSGLREFLIFPLPSNSGEYVERLNAIGRLFPNGALRSEAAGSQTFLIGAAADLPLLFRSTAPRSQVYTKAYTSP